MRVFRCSFQLIGLKLVNDNLRAFDIVFTDTGKRKRILGSPSAGRMRKDRHQYRAPVSHGGGRTSSRLYTIDKGYIPSDDSQLEALALKVVTSSIQARRGHRKMSLAERTGLRCRRSLHRRHRRAPTVGPRFEYHW